MQSVKLEHLQDAARRLADCRPPGRDRGLKAVVSVGTQTSPRHVPMASGYIADTQDALATIDNEDLGTK